jgi:hypothetical protein
MRTGHIRTILAVSLLCVTWPLHTANAQTVDDGQSAIEAGKQAANPLSSQWLLQIQQNSTWIDMPSEGDARLQSNLQIQPLLSLKFTDNWNLIMRPVVPVASTPYVDSSGHGERAIGLGDTVFAAALSPGPAKAGNWLLAAGATSVFPTATESTLGQDKWQLGPSGAVGYAGTHFLTYVFPQQWFSIGGDGPRTSQMNLQYAFVYFLSNGWSVGTNPAAQIDWKAPDGDKVAFPIGLQIGKVRTLGRLPVKFDAQVQYYVARPDVHGPKWNLQFTITPVIPSPSTSPLF